MDLSHSAWSDIFFLGMDFPEGARVLNVSVNLGVRGQDAEPKPPIEVYLRVIDEPVLRLVGTDLQCSAAVRTVAEVFDFAKDYLGLLKAGVIASGLVPAGLEGSRASLEDVFGRIIGPGLGIELVSKVNDIPKGSRLAVSTTLLAAIIAARCCHGAGAVFERSATEPERRLVAARAILGEWLGGSGGGWQDSGGLWPGIKLIEGRRAEQNDPEYGVSRGRLLPDHRIFRSDEIAVKTRDDLCRSLVLVHGGMAQDVGPILQMVTEKYLLRLEAEWQGRLAAIALMDEIEQSLLRGDIRRLASATSRNFDGPIQTIIPWACNHYTSRLIAQVKQEFAANYWGFLMLGGMSGGGMGFLFDPGCQRQAQDYLQRLLCETKRELEHALPFAMDPVVYDFSINDHGTQPVCSKAKTP